MSGRRARQGALTAAVAVGAALVLLAVTVGTDLPLWSVPLLTVAGLLLCELVSLSRSLAPDARVERPALTAALTGRLLFVSLLALAGATVALLAAAVPVRHGLATGLLGAAAATALFLVVGTSARRDRDD